MKQDQGFELADTGECDYKKILNQFVRPIAKRAKSKNRMQITEFPARLSRHELVLREIQGM